MENLEGPEAYRQFGNNPVTFIAFNYDRSLEHFLFISLSSLFQDVPEQEIADQIAKIGVHHVYGCVDKLPWQGGGKGYGSRYFFDDINCLKENIRLIGDRSNVENIAEIKTEIRRASQMLYLGFAFAPENLQVLGFPALFSNHPGIKIRGTGMGFTQQETQRVKNTFMVALSAGSENRVIIDDCDCKMLLRNHL